MQSDGEHVTWNKYGCESSFSRGEFIQTVMAPAKQEPILSVQPGTFQVKVYPNPSSIDFGILVTGKSNEPVTVRILDMNGKLRSVQNTTFKSQYY